MGNKQEDELIFVGYTNGDQIRYVSESREERGLFFGSTDGDCYIPLYMLKNHAHRIETTSLTGATIETIKENWSNENP